jgi:hypothetical protein
MPVCARQRRGADRRAKQLSTGRHGLLRRARFRRCAGDRKSRDRGRGALARKRRQGSARQAAGLLSRCERAALSDRRSGYARRHPPCAWARRCGGDAHRERRKHRARPARLEPRTGRDIRRGRAGARALTPPRLRATQPPGGAEGRGVLTDGCMAGDRVIPSSPDHRAGLWFRACYGDAKRAINPQILPGRAPPCEPQPDFVQFCWL